MKGADKPKRPATGFFQWRKEVGNAELTKQYPDGFKGHGAGAMSKKLGEMWSELEDEEKNTWNQGFTEQFEQWK